MALARTALMTVNPGATDGLAAARTGPFGRAMSAAASVDPVAKLRHAKQRLYVLCQAGAWGGFTVLQILFYRLAKDVEGATSGRGPLVDQAIVVMIMLTGLLLTHYVRLPVHRWGWKELGWAALIPRVLGMSVLLGVVWTAAGYAYIYLALAYPWESKFSPLVIMSGSVINGACLFTGWFSIYFVYHAFERMQRMQVEQLRLAATAKDAELRALKSQVNPHFLFNSLNSLRALVDEDPPRAREAVTRMANMLRYSLQSGQQETVAFEDELRIVEDYLALEQIRHENRLTVRWDVTDDARTRALPVPPMLLQTLVENAVKYGIGTRRAGGEIAIRARCEGGALRIRVTNPGELTAGSDPAESTGVGLRNAAERLKLLFGERATLTLRPEPAGSVTAEVFIPLPPGNP